MDTNGLMTIYYIVSMVIMTISMLLAVVSLVCSQRALTKELRAANDRMAAQLQHNQDLQTKQAQQTFFAEYTKRYQDIILHLPNDEKDPQWLKYVQLYFDLCSEEYHLREMGLIDDKVWTLWVEGMQDAMKHKSFEAAWKFPIAQHYSDQSFISFVHNELIKKESSFA